MKNMAYKNTLLLLFATLMLFSFQTAKQDYVPMKDVAAFRSGLAKMAASTSSIKANFKQEKYLAILANKIESDGKIQFKKPNLLKWEYTVPYQYAIILNGKEIIINDQGKQNSFDIASSQSFKQINELIVNSVQGNILDEKQFNIQYLEGKSLYLAKLQPKEEQMKKFLKGIEVFFNKDDYTVSQIRLIEPEDDYTHISFQDMKLNEPISDAVFAKKK